MNTDQIFDLFLNPDSPEEDNFIDIYNHPLFNIGKFKKIISNIKNYNFNLHTTLQEQNPDLDKETILLLGEKILYNKAYSYLFEIDIKDSKIKEIIKAFGDSLLKECINKSIKHFELREEYEKCAFLTNILSAI